MTSSDATVREPASQCPDCGTWRTPGVSHTPNDTDDWPKSAIFTGTCSG